ncbi:MAG: HAD family hydrolase [Gammaproteobacteria bacterium]|nr:HAD family hydrolase [Gammaproteobacteria bacterium]
MTIKIISFDLDDTLWPCMPTIHQAEKNLHHWYSEHFPEITCKYSIEDLWKQRKQLFANNPHLSHNISAIRKLSLKLLAKEFNYSETKTKQLLSKGFEKYLYERNQVTLYDEVYNVIENLSKNYILFSISNGNAKLSMTLTGLEQFFSYSHNAEASGVQKPHPKIFNEIKQHASINYQARADEIIHIGDDPETDIFGAMNVGLKTIWINRENKTWPSHLPYPDKIITDLLQVTI